MKIFSCTVGSVHLLMCSVGLLTCSVDVYHVLCGFSHARAVSIYSRITDSSHVQVADVSHVLYGILSQVV